MTRRRWIILLVLLLLAGGGGFAYWFLATHEYRTVETREDISPQARRNPFLAAERFLQQVGVETKSISGRDKLLKPPAEPGVLFVNSLGSNLPLERERALLTWVKQGGHLILVARKAWHNDEEGSGDSLLDRFGVRLYTNFRSPNAPLEGEQQGQECRARPDEDEEQDDPEPESGLEQLLGNDEEWDEKWEKRFEPIDFEFTDHQQLTAQFDSSRTLLDSANSAIRIIDGVYGPHLLQYQVEDGLLSILSDNRLFTNDEIGEHDHALLLAQLVGQTEQAWLLYSSNMPSLLTLLWRNTPYLVLSLLLLALLALWRATERSGPQLAKEGDARRSLLEHLEAAANFTWRSDRSAELFQAAQKGIEQRWHRRHLALGAMEPKERCIWIAEQSGLKPEQIESALYHPITSEQDLVAISKIQQNLLTALEPESRANQGA